MLAEFFASRVHVIASWELMLAPYWSRTVADMPAVAPGGIMKPLSEFMVIEDACGAALNAVRRPAGAFTVA